MTTTQTQGATLKRSQIPSNRLRRQAAICRTKAAEFREQGKRKLAANAERWAKEFDRQRTQREESDRLIHYQPVPRGVCSRRDNKTDERVVTDVPDHRPTTHFIQGGTITDSGVSSHLENVDCLVCRRWVRSNPRKRQ